MELYDVIIVGGGPAGSTAATLLSRQGNKVLLLEKEKFPREHIGESLIPAAYDILNKLGILEDLKKISPRKPGVQFMQGNGQNQSLWCFKTILNQEKYLSFHVKRSAFDELLLNNSRKSGAQVMEETAVRNVVLDNMDGSVEVVAESKSGGRSAYRGKFLLDCSGQSTFMGSKLGVKKSFAGLDRVALWSHWSNADFDIPLKQGVIKLIYLSGEKKGWFWIIPISSDNLSIGVVVENSYVKKEKIKFTAQGQDWRQELYMQEINDSIAVKKIVQNATMSHNVQVNGDYSYYCEKKFGDNYALIGDAAAFLDPIFSSGMFVGMHSAELISEALHRKLHNKEEDALVQVYEKINGAVKLLEKFIRLFYTPEVLSFAEMGNPKQMISYEKTEKTYLLFHYLLAGDFFANHQKYSDFIDTMRDPKMVDKFRNLIRHTKLVEENASCGEDYEEMYGKVTQEVVFDNKQLP